MAEKEHFEVRDKRRFVEGLEEEKKEEKPVEETLKQAQEAKEEEKKEHEKAEQSTPLSEINFSSFIFSLGRSAFIHLGEEPDPVTGETRISLPMAKETIDIISILEEKTKGNLTSDEEQLIKNILYALRMKYVEIASKKSESKS